MLLQRKTSVSEAKPVGLGGGHSLVFRQEPDVAVLAMHVCSFLRVQESLPSATRIELQKLVQEVKSLRDENNPTERNTTSE